MRSCLLAVTLLLPACEARTVCFGDCDTGVTTGDTVADASPYSGDWSGTVSASVEQGWYDPWRCEGDATLSVDADGASTGDLSCGDHYEGFEGPFVGTLDDGTLTGTWTLHTYDGDVGVPVQGSVDGDRLEASFEYDDPDGWRLENGALLATTTGPGL